MSDFETRFGGIARLYGQSGLERLRAAHVCVVGIGGVGTWSAEGLARSGIGALTLVDLDEVCASNINRQLHALTETVGRAKVEVMAERIRAINPDCRVIADQKFFNEQSAAELLTPKFDFVLDAIDSVTNKVLLLANCRQKNLPVVACGGAGGRRDGTLVRTADLAKVSHRSSAGRSAEKTSEGISISRRWLNHGRGMRFFSGGTGVCANRWFGLRKPRAENRGRHPAELQRWPRLRDVRDRRVWFRGGGDYCAQNCRGVILSQAWEVKRRMTELFMIQKSARAFLLKIAQHL